MAKKHANSTAAASSHHHVIDPAERYYDRSRRNREAYRKAMSMGTDQNSWSGDCLADQHQPAMQQEGNARSRSGFDFRTFRNKP